MSITLDCPQEPRSEWVVCASGNTRDENSHDGLQPTETITGSYPLNLLVQGPSWTPSLLHGYGEGGDVVDSSTLPISGLKSNNKTEAYVTMITSNDVGFIAGALVSVFFLEG